MENKKFKILISIIIIISIVLRIFVIEITPLNDSTQVDSEMGIPQTLDDYEELYDLNKYDLKDPGHFYYIMYLYTYHELPDNTLGQLYHPPVHYMLSATWLGILENLSLDSIQKVEGLQYLGLIYFIISVILVYKLLERIKLSNEAKILIMLLYCFYPKFVEITTYITNDFLVYIFELISLLYLIKWNKDTDFKNSIVLALFVGLGTLTKINCVVMLVPIGICYLLKFINNIKNKKDKKDNSILVLQGIIFWIIFLCLGLSYVLRCMILHGEYHVPIPLDSLYIGDASFFETWGINLKEIIFLSNQETKNVWSGFLYTSLVNEGLDFRIGVGILNFILMILSLICIFKNLKTKEINLKIILSTFIFQLIAFVFYNIKNPYTCTWNSRYILITIFLGIIYMGKMYDQTNNKFLKILEYVIALVFCIFSALSFLV